MNNVTNQAYNWYIGTNPGSGNQDQPGACNATLPIWRVNGAPATCTVQDQLWDLCAVGREGGGQRGAAGRRPRGGSETLQEHDEKGGGGLGRGKSVLPAWRGMRSCWLVGCLSRLVSARLAGPLIITSVGGGVCVCLDSIRTVT